MPRRCRLRPRAELPALAPAATNQKLAEVSQTRDLRPPLAVAHSSQLHRATPQILEASVLRRDSSERKTHEEFDAPFRLRDIISILRWDAFLVTSHPDEVCSYP